VDELISRQMPHSIEAEQAVLGSMLIDARCVGDVVGAVKASDFYSSVNRDIFETIYSMFTYSMATDPVTVLEQMRVHGVWTETSASYLLELVNITPTSANVMEYAAIVRDTALLRAIADSGNDIVNMALDGEGGAATILEAAEKKIYALRQDRTVGGLVPLSSSPRAPAWAKRASRSTSRCTWPSRPENRSPVFLWRCPASSWPCAFCPRRALSTEKSCSPGS
jgi:replicative DNA helicase